MLCLLESSQGGQLQEAALQLDFQSALLPHVALDVSEPQPCLYAMTARGFLHAVSLSGGPPQPSAPGQRVGLSRLAAVSPESSITSTDLSAGVHAQAAGLLLIRSRGSPVHSAHQRTWCSDDPDDHRLLQAGMSVCYCP